jgi:hypothetical protein
MGMTDIIRNEKIDGAPRLKLAFPRASVRGAGGALAASLTEEGSLVSAGPSPRRAAWRFENLGEASDEAFLAGPGFEGRSLDSGDGVEDGFPLLFAAVKALDLLWREDRLPRGIVSSGLLVGPGGEVLVLPASAVARALSARGPEVRSSAAARLVHPRSGGPEGDASFLIAQAAYRFAAGVHPYPREASEPGSSAPPSPPVVPLALAAPRLDPELAAMADEALADPGAVPLSRWRAALDQASSRGWLRELGPDEEAELSRRRAAALEAARRKDAASSFFRRRGVLIAGIAAGAALVGLFAATMLGRGARMPDLSALSSIQVARAYYRALDSLDLETLEVAAGKKAREEDDNLAVNITVLMKTRLAYEGKDPMVSASKWLAAGKPQIGQNDMLYGVTGLSLEEPGGAPTDEIGSTGSVRASYSLWFVEKSGTDLDAYSVPVEQKRIDDLVLKKTKAGWKIVELRRTVPQPAASP